MNSVMSRISVVVPVYNVKDYLHRCIDNILIQLFTDFELIVVDDGSPDCSGCICDEYIEFDSRITVIHKKNGGLSSARNIALDLSFKNRNSEWITFIDSDDWVHSKYLETLYNAIVDTNCQISICRYQEVSDNDSCIENNDINVQIVNTEDFFCEHNVNAVIACGKLYKLDLFSNIRFPFGKLHEDDFTTYKLLFEHSQLSFISVPLYYYYQNNSSITRSMWTPRRLDSLEAMQNQIDYFRDHGLHQAYNRSIFNAAMNISRNYMEIGILEDAKKKKKYRKMLQFELRKILRYKDAKVILPFSDYKPIYEIAYTNFMKQYWRVQSVKSKFKR